MSMEFQSKIKEVKAKTDTKGNSYVEMRLDAIRCGDINLDDAKSLLGKAVRVRIDQLGINLPGMEGA